MSQQPFSSATSNLNKISLPALIRQNVVWLGMTIIALLSIPDGDGGWPVFWLLVAAMLGGAGLTEIHLARSLEEPRAVLLPLAIAGSSAITAVIISLVLQPVSGLLLILILIVLAIAGKQRTFVTAALTVVLIPWWVWLALDQWHWELLVTAPLVGLGLIAVSHLLDTHAWPADEKRIQSERAHRYAAWLFIALSGILLITVGLLADVSSAFLALAGIVLAVAIPLEAGYGSIGGSSARQSIRVVVSAYLVAVACWLVGIA